MGLLWVITDDDREATARRVLSDTAPDVAVELLRQLTADASRATDRLTAARELLEGRPVAGLRSLIGTDPTGGFVALALQPPVGAQAGPSPDGELDPSAARPSSPASTSTPTACRAWWRRRSPAGSTS